MRIVIHGLFWCSILLLAACHQRHDASTDLALRQDLALYTPVLPTVMGEANAPVTVVDFFDYACSHCRDLQQSFGQVERAFPGKLHFVYREMPLINANARFVAQSALAASRQGKYSAYHRALMQLQLPLDEAQLQSLARRLGLDPSSFAHDQRSNAVLQQLQRNASFYRRLGVEGIPVFIVARTHYVKGHLLKVCQAQQHFGYASGQALRPIVAAMLKQPCA
jgi:protein-disulfide isomerase